MGVGSDVVGCSFSESEYITISTRACRQFGRAIGLAKVQDLNLILLKGISSEADDSPFLEPEDLLFGAISTKEIES